MNTADIQNSVKAIALRNPFSMQRDEFFVGEGHSVLQIVKMLDLPPYASVIVSLKGDLVKSEDWGKVYPKSGDFFTIKTVPTGGGGKDVFRTILTVLVIIGAGIAAPYLAPAFTKIGIGTNIAQGLAFGAASTVGMLAVNALAPPPTTPVVGQSFKESNSYYISGARNGLPRYGPIPQILGKIRCVPPNGALPYTESEGKLQTVFQSFLISKGKNLIYDYKIGETLLTSYTGVEFESSDGVTVPNWSIYTGDVYPEALSITVAQTSGWLTRTTQTNTKRAGLEFVFQRGLCLIDESGNRAQTTVNLEVQYAPTGTTNWVGSVLGTSIPQQTVDVDFSAYLLKMINSNSSLYYTVVLNKFDGSIKVIFNVGSEAPCPTDFHLLGVFSISNLLGVVTMSDRRTAEVTSWGFAPSVVKLDGLLIARVTVGAGTLYAGSMTILGQTAEALFKSTYIAFPTVGQYDVRVRRTTADSNNDRLINEVTWIGLKSYQNSSPILETDITRVDVKIQASDQLSGAIEQFNLIGHTICLDYDYNSGTWIERATNNPASLYRLVLQGGSNKRALADSDVDLETLAQFHNRCRLNNWTFNHYLDYRASVDTLLKMIASAGRAKPGRKNGKRSVVMDQPQVNYAQHFAPRNIWDYTYQKTFINLPHAYRVRFQNELKDYLEDERIVCDDGYSEDGLTPGTVAATLIEEMELPGITSPSLAWSHGRYHIATARLRPETHTFYADAENLTCTPGDLILFSNDVISVGLGSGRVKSYTDNGTYVTSITVDEIWSMEAGKTYGFRIRQDDGSTLVIALTTVAGTGSTFFLTSQITVANAPDIGALVLYGETDEEAIDLIVREIEPGPQLIAMITAVAYAPEVHLADQGAIPNFDTHITIPYDPANEIPGIPKILDIESGIRAIDFSGGSRKFRIIVTLGPPDSTRVAIQKYLIRYRIVNGYSDWQTITVESADLTAILSNVYLGSEYEIQARSISVYGLGSPWSSSVTNTVTGDAIQAVTNIRCSATGDLTWLARDLDITWDEPDILTLSHVRVEILNQAESVILRSYRREKGQTSFNYAYDLNKQDHNSAASYSVKVRVVAVDLNQAEAASSIVNFVNPIPYAPTNLVTTAGSAGVFEGRILDTVFTASANSPDLEYYTMEVTHGAAVLRTEILYSESYQYTYEKNVEDGNGTPSNSVVLMLRAWDAFGRSSGYLTVTFTNPPPAAPSGLAATPWMNAISFEWDKGTESDLDYYEYRSVVGLDSWAETRFATDVNSRRLILSLTNAQAQANPTGAPVTFRVRAVDTFGTPSAESEVSGTTEAIYVEPTPITDISQLSAAFPTIPVLVDDIWTNNSPAAGRLAWNEHELWYSDIKYTIAAGNTPTSSHRYIYWVNGDSVYTTSDTDPTATLGATDFIIAENISGSVQKAWDAEANKLIGSAYLGAAAVLKANIGALQVVDAHIFDLDAVKLRAGTLTIASFATALQAATQNSRNYQGGNMIKNSDFAAGVGEDAGWETQTYLIASPYYGVNYEDGSGKWKLQSSNTAYLYQPNRNGTADVYMRLLAGPIAVEYGKRYCFSFYYHGHRCPARGNIVEYDGDLAYIADFGTTGELSPILPANQSLGAKSLDKYTRGYMFYTPSSTSVQFVRPTMIKYDTIEGETTSYGFFTLPMFCEVGADQTEPPPYVVNSGEVQQYEQETVNLCDNSCFEIDNYTLGSGNNTKVWQRWTNHNQDPISWFTDVASPTAAWTPTGSTCGTICQHGVSETRLVSGYSSSFYRDFKCIPGQQYCVSVYTGAHRARNFCYMIWLDASFGYIGQTAIPDHSVNDNMIGGQSLDSFKRIYNMGVAPSNAVWCRINIVKNAHEDGSPAIASYAFFTRVMFSSVALGATTPPKYTAPHVPPILTENVPDNSIGMTGTFIGFKSTGGNWPIRIHNDNGTGKFYVGNLSNRFISFDGSSFSAQLSKLYIDAVDGIELTSAASIKVSNGCDINLYGSDADPGVINFIGTNYTTYIGADTDGNRFSIEPVSNGQYVRLFIGYGQLGTQFGYIYTSASQYYEIIAGSTGVLGTRVQINSSIGSAPRWDFYLRNPSVGKGLSAELRTDNLLIWCPGVDGGAYLGDGTRRWMELWATNPSIVTSDERLKESISALAVGIDFLNKLNPVSYIDIGSEDRKRKVGFSAQEVEYASIADFEGEDLGLIKYAPESDVYGIRYSAFVPILVEAVKEHDQFIQDMVGMIEQLSTQIQNLRKTIDGGNRT